MGTKREARLASETREMTTRREEKRRREKEELTTEDCSDGLEDGHSCVYRGE